MQAGIHPTTQEIKVQCSCGNKFTVMSTLKDKVNVEKCDKCHHVYTGQKMRVGSADSVQKFRDRFGDL